MLVEELVYLTKLPGFQRGLAHQSEAQGISMHRRDNVFCITMYPSTHGEYSYAGGASVSIYKFVKWEL